MSQSDQGVPEIVNTRHFAETPERVFGAMQDPAVLARWWGPSGFTNTISAFDFRAGGIWRIIMRGPDGTEYPNESRFVEILPPRRLVFEHVGPVHGYRMTMTFAAEGTGTRLTWHMRFATAEEYAKVKDFVAAANEQNFDRLEAVLGHDDTFSSPKNADHVR